MTFDFDRFKMVLYSECKSVFSSIIKELASEDIYSVALYYSGDDWLYLFPTVSTKSGLSKVVIKYKEKEYFQNKPIDELEATLKWSPCDSPHHEDYVSALSQTDKILLQAQFMDELMEEENYEAFNLRLIKICMNVLKQLDTDGIFDPLDRSSFVLNLLSGDQSEEERLERAKILNIENAFMPYKLEIEQLISSP